MDAGDWERSDAVLDRAREYLDGDRDAALVTLVDVDGRAYRRPGAKRLVDPDGDGVGTVVPGCLDSRLRRLAESVLEDGDPTLATFDLDEGETWGVGVGCDGVVELLVEPLGRRLEGALDAYADGRTVGVATVLDGVSGVSIGNRAVFEEEGSLVDGDLPAWLREPVSRVLAENDERTPGTVTVETPTDAAVDDSRGTVDVFLDWFAPPPRLVVFGTGPDVEPLVEAGRLAGFDVTVVGFRGANARPERFPNASNVVSTRPSAIREVVELDADTAVVVATHNFVDDRLTVAELLETPVPYVGVVGSRDRFERLLGALDRRLSAVDRERLYGPAGLDLGGETPEQIALSVVSEALSVRNDRTPGHLRERAGTIHERSSPGSDQSQ